MRLRCKSGDERSEKKERASQGRKTFRQYMVLDCSRKKEGGRENKNEVPSRAQQVRTKHFPQERNQPKTMWASSRIPRKESWPTRANQSQPEPTRSNQIQPDPTTANQSQPDPTRSNQIQPERAKNRPKQIASPGRPTERRKKPEKKS
jgi:hypothetical protein